MTTHDPDTLIQDSKVLKRIAEEFDGTMALDCAVIWPGMIRTGDPAQLLPEGAAK